MSLSLNKPKLDNLANEIRKSAERLSGKFKAYEYKGVILPIIAIRRQISQAEIGAVRGGKLIAASDDSILQPQLSWEKDCIEAAAVIKCSGKFFMFQAGAYNNAPQQFDCAVSDDWPRILPLEKDTVGLLGEIISGGV